MSNELNLLTDCIIGSPMKHIWELIALPFVFLLTYGIYGSEIGIVALTAYLFGVFICNI